MKKRGHLKIIAVFLCVNLLPPSAFVFAEPLNLTLPKDDLKTELRIFSIDFNDRTPATSFVIEQIVKRIESSAVFVPRPRSNSGERIYGSVKVAITIHKNGALMNIEAGAGGLADSADQLLAEAAIKIIESAAPFAPMPIEYFPGSDAIRFMRTFEFHRDKNPIAN